jgi:hypothetical protein
MVIIMTVFDFCSLFSGFDLYRRFHICPMIRSLKSWQALSFIPCLVDVCFACKAQGKKDTQSFINSSRSFPWQSLFVSDVTSDGVLAADSGWGEDDQNPSKS